MKKIPYDFTIETYVYYIAKKDKSHKESVFLIIIISY